MTVRGPGNVPIRERRRMDRPRYDGGRAAYSMLLGLSAFLLVGTLSFYQLSSPAVARQLIAEGVAALTELDLLLAETEDELETAARGADDGGLVAVPGYPLEVRLTSREVLDSEPAELRELILLRSAAIVYDDGLEAFDQGSADISLFSSEGLLNWLVGQLSDTNHSRSGFVAAFFGVLTALAAVMVTVRSHGFARVRSLAIPLMVASIAGLIAVGLIMRPVLGRWWGGDPFGDAASSAGRCSSSASPSNSSLASVFAGSTTTSSSSNSPAHRADGQSGRSGQRSQAGRRARHVRRPCLISSM
jgi:hypothetical protein